MRIQFKWTMTNLSIVDVFIISPNTIQPLKVFPFLRTTTNKVKCKVSRYTSQGTQINQGYQGICEL